jgi:signal transduction histidine kinase
MTKRLLLSYLSVALLVLLLLELPLAVFYSQRELGRFTSDVSRDASVLATMYEDDLERGVPLDPGPAESYERRTGARVVVTDAAGISSVDTDEPVPRDFSTRPEVATALTGRLATGARRSNTLNTELVYVAVPIASGGTVHGVLRLTLSASEVDQRIHRFWLGLAAIGAVVFATMALVGWTIARSIAWPIRQLNDRAARFAAGDLSAGPPVGGPNEIRELARTMSDMAGRLAAMLDEQRAFVADASHQLRTPLTALRLRLENLRSRLAEADGAELDAAIDETSRLAVLVTDLLQLARADEPRPVQPVDLAALAAERVDVWGAVAGERSVGLELVGGDSAATALAAPGAVEQMLDNVLDNALNASPPGGTVTVSVDASDVAVRRLAVSDEGPGLGDADKERALRRFWRGSTDTPGTGLGLAVVESLARACGGSVRLEDAREPDGDDHADRGRGLRVVIELPAPTS